MGPPPLASASPRGAARDAADALAAVLVGAWLLLKTFALAPAPSDEFIYLYMCRRIVEGAIPYRDFFFAHPPLHLLPGTALGALAGFTVEVARLVPIASAVLAAIAVYRIGRRAGALAGIVALTLFLFSYDLLRASSHYTGATESAALLAWSLERALAGRPTAAGGLAAGAALIAFYALPPAAALGAVLLLARAGALRFAGAFAAGFLGVNFLCLLAFGRDYWDPVIRYHLLKPVGAEGQAAAYFVSLAAENAWLVWGAAAAAAGWFLFRPPGVAAAGAGGASLHLADAWTPAVAGLWGAALHLLLLSATSPVFTYYFVPAFPGLAVAGGMGYAEALRGLGRALRPSDGGAARRRAAGAAMGAILLAGAPALRLALAIPWDAGHLSRTPRRYAWNDAALPDSLNAALRALLWRPEPPTAWTPAVTRYLQHESLTFEAPSRLAERVRTLTPAGGTLFGDSLSAPLVALLADRRIALDEVDTNQMRFASGITPPEALVARLETAPPAAVIASPLQGFFLSPALREWVTSHYRLAEVIHDPLYGPYLLYVRRTGAGIPGA